MKIAIPKETTEFEKRVAASPETVKKLIALGAEVIVEEDAGLASNFTNDAYTKAGAKLAKGSKVYEKSIIVLKVRAPQLGENKSPDEMKNIPSKAALIGLLQPHQNKELIATAAKNDVTTFSMEMVPRITRAQSMDVLSSQSNLSGYKAVIDAAELYGKAFPMMMTAAGTIAPARVLVFGAGVAGLQAIATAKRLGAIVSAFDVRSETKEQVESLGGRFVEVESDESGDSSGGYAKEMSEDYKKRQAAKIEETLAKTDIVITTALIPGKPAPRLITDKMVQLMKPGSVIVDLAVESGGNVEGSKLNKVIERNGVKIMGPANMPSRIATDASALYSKNLLNFVGLLIKDGKLDIDWDDEIIKATCLTHDGQIVNEQFKA